MAKARRKRETYVQVDCSPPACPFCQSTDREPYFDVVTLHQSGVWNGKEFTRIRRKRTRCKSCRRFYLVRFFEHPKPAEAPESSGPEQEAPKRARKR